MTERKIKYSSVSVVPRAVPTEYRDPILGRITTTATPAPGYPFSRPLDIDGCFLGVTWLRGVTPTIFLHLVPSLIMRGAVPPFENVFIT